jgi:iron(III) transport system substrate-binding protein
MRKGTNMDWIRWNGFTAGWAVVLALAFPGGSYSQEKDWQQQWATILAAARKEGKVIVAGPPDPKVRQEVPNRFKARFGIPVEYVAGGRGGEDARRLKIERRAGVYTIDVYFGGTSTTSVFYQEKMLDPIRPLLILPEALDPSKWKKGKPVFSDPQGSYALRMLSRVRPLFYINANFAKPEEFKSMKDLLNPKWRGKISAFDPTVSGSGVFNAAQYYQQFGEDFIKRLYVDQKPTFSRDFRQVADWLARGTLPISLDLAEAYAEELKRDGFPVYTVLTLPDMPGRVASSLGEMVLLNKAPHPNAARVFVNWIASKEGLEAYSKSYGSVPMRNDIDESYLAPYLIPKPGVNYFDSGSWEFLAAVEKSRLRIKELLGK